MTTQSSGLDFTVKPLKSGAFIERDHLVTELSLAPVFLVTLFKVQFLFCDMLITLGRIASIFGRFGQSVVLPSSSCFVGSSPVTVTPRRARSSREQLLTGEWLRMGIVSYYYDLSGKNH